MGSRVIIAGTGSGCGKTSITCGILWALLEKEKKVASFKCGPDFVDSLFHRTMLGISSYNLDLFLSGEKGVKRLLKTQSKKADISIIEGVMGFYDGIMGDRFKASSYDLSQKTNTPVILVVNGKGKAVSVAAEINGYLNFAPNQIKGIILNNVSESMSSYYREIVEQYCKIKVIGCMPFAPEAVIEERKLGLFEKDKEQLKKKIEILGKNSLKNIDIDGIIEISNQATNIQADEYNTKNIGKLTIAVASDNAFCFSYAYNLKLLRRLGATIIFFSPLDDKALPENINGLIIGGGYIGEHIEKIAANITLLAEIKQKIEQGLPTIVEGGGLVLLANSYTDLSNDTYKMAGLIPTNITVSEKLENFGYHTLTANSNNLLCDKGEKINVHEFHYFSTNNSGNSFIAEKISRKKNRKCGFATETLFSGFPYTYFCGNEILAENFIKKCLNHKAVGVNV